MEVPVEPEYKVVMVGDAFVGKTSLVNRFWNQSFNKDETPTIAASYLQVPIEVDGSSQDGTSSTVKLNIWDTAGTEKFQCLVPLYARTADALVIVFDVTNLPSFEGAKKWYKNVIEETGGVSLSVLCANKSDMNPEFDDTSYRAWAEENHMLFMVTSALNGSNVKETFQKIASTLYKSHFPVSTKPEIKEAPEEKGCC